MNYGYWINGWMDIKGAAKQQTNLHACILYIMVYDKVIRLTLPSAFAGLISWTQGMNRILKTVRMMKITILTALFFVLATSWVGPDTTLRKWLCWQVDLASFNLIGESLYILGHKSLSLIHLEQPNSGHGWCQVQFSNCAYITFSWRQARYNHYSLSNK